MSRSFSKQKARCIARILFDDKIDTPAVYFGKQNKGVWKSKEEFPNPYNWSGYIVGQILSKPEYMGHTVNFRSHKQSYKDKTPIMNPPEEWLIFENTHEAIVDAETWELAQKLRKTPRRHDTLGEANPLTGLVFCADCGAKMMNHRSRGGTENNPYPSDFYDCSTYTLAHQKRTHACSGHYIRSKVLRELILETIRAASTFAISDRDAFLEKVRSASQLRQAEAAKETKRKLNKEEKRISELDTIIKKLYESFAVGRITGERFDSLLAEYEAEQKALTASVSEMETQMSVFAEDTDRAKQFLELAKKYTDFSELTTPMINEFNSCFFLVINPSVQYETKWVSERSVWMLRSDALLRYSFFYSGDNDYRNSVVSFCNTALLLISDFFSTPLANQKEARYNMTK